MKIKLTNGIELNPYIVTGGSRNVQGANRDTLTFVFPVSVGLTAIDEAFTAANCESIIIETDDGVQNVHKGYTIRAELSQKDVTVQNETDEVAGLTETRIFVSMSLRTYLETQLASLTDTVDILVMESLMAE
mgnify:CR=1 FL=1